MEALAASGKMHTVSVNGVQIVQLTDKESRKMFVLGCGWVGSSTLLLFYCSQQNLPPFHQFDAVSSGQPMKSWTGETPKQIGRKRYAEISEVVSVDIGKCSL